MQESIRPLVTICNLISTPYKTKHLIFYVTGITTSTTRTARSPRPQPICSLKPLVSGSNQMPSR